MASSTSSTLSINNDNSSVEELWSGHTINVQPLVSHFDSATDDPREFPRATKFLVSFFVSGSTLLVTLATSEYTGAFYSLGVAFGAPTEVVVLGLSLMLFGFAIGPMVWAPLSEWVGRKPVMIVSLSSFFLLQLGCALAPSIASILVCRFLMGIAGSAPLSVSAGIIADMYAPNERGPAMAFYALAPLMGPVAGPIIGSAIAVSGVAWQWTFWIIFISAGVAVFASLFVPETFAPLLLSRLAARKSKETGLPFATQRDIDSSHITTIHLAEAYILRPFRILFLEPIVLMISIYMALIYGTMYLLFEAIPIIYSELRGWNELLASLVFISLGVGFIVGLLAVGISQRLYMKQVNPATGRAPPEARLFAAMWAAVVLPICFFWFAWTCSPVSIPWPASVTSLILFGFGMAGLFLSGLNYVIDAYPDYAASAVAANAFLRSVLGGAFPLFAGFMYDGMGVNWASTLLAFVCLALAPIPFLFYRYGSKLRAYSKNALQDPPVNTRESSKNALLHNTTATSLDMTQDLPSTTSRDSTQELPTSMESTQELTGKE